MIDRRHRARWSQAPRYLAPVRPWWCYPKWVMPVLVGGLIIYVAAQGQLGLGSQEPSFSLDASGPASAAPRFVAPARRDREDAPRGKLLGNQDEVQAWHSGRGAAPSCASYTGLIPADASVTEFCIRKIGV